MQAQGDAVDTTIRIHHYDTRADGEACSDGDIDVLVVDDSSNGASADEQLKAVVTGAIQFVAARPGRGRRDGPRRASAIVEPVPSPTSSSAKSRGAAPTTRPPPSS